MQFRMKIVYYLNEESVKTPFKQYTIAYITDGYSCSIAS